MNKIIKYGAIILLILLSLMCVYNFYTLFGFEKVCTHVECTDWSEGKEWVGLHCVANDTINDFMCDFDWDGQTFVGIPLKVVQEKIPNVRSCKKAECASEFLGKGTNVQELKKQTNDVLSRMEVRKR